MVIPKYGSKSWKGLAPENVVTFLPSSALLTIAGAVAAAHDACAICSLRPQSDPHVCRVGGSLFAARRPIRRLRAGPGLRRRGGRPDRLCHSVDGTAAEPAGATRVVLHGSRGRCPWPWSCLSFGEVFCPASQANPGAAAEADRQTDRRSVNDELCAAVGSHRPAVDRRFDWRSDYRNGERKRIP